MSRFKKWYDRNSDEYNEKRRTKYKENEAYRERVLNYSKKNVNTINENVVQIELNNELLSSPVYTAKDLADLLGCTPQALYKWEKNGTIPSTPLTDSNGARYYPESLVILIVTVLKNRDKISPLKNKEFDRGVEYWNVINKKDLLIEKKRFFTRKRFCEKLGISEEQLSEWEESGMLPIPETVDKNFVPLYTSEAVSAMSLCIDEFRKTKVADKEKIFNRINNILDNHPRYELISRTVKDD